MLSGLLRAAIFVGLYIGLTQCRTRTNPGSSYSTQLRQIEFRDNWEARLANPCRVVEVEISADWSQTEDVRPKDFNEKMIEDIKSALEKLETVESANPSPPQCPGMTLSSLPPTPDLMNLNDDELMVQVYQSGIYLLAHLEIVCLDREIATGIEMSGQEGTFLQCGNEKRFYVNSVRELINSISDILCRLTRDGASKYQRSAFRTPLRNLLQTEIVRDHSACTFYEIRDCTVFREAHRALNQFHSKFAQLISESKSQHFYGKGQSSMFAPDSNYLK